MRKKKKARTAGETLRTCEKHQIVYNAETHEYCPQCLKEATKASDVFEALFRRSKTPTKTLKPPSPRDQPLTQIEITIPVRTHNHLTALAQERDSSVSELIRRAIDNAFPGEHGEMPWILTEAELKKLKRKIARDLLVKISLMLEETLD